MIPDKTILVSIDIVNMYPSIENDSGIAARNALVTKANKSPSTDCIIEGLEICLKCNNSRLGSQNLLQLNGIATGAPNSCSFAVFNIDKNVLQAKRNTYQEMRYFGRYCDDCLVLWTGPLEKLELFLMLLNSIDSNLNKNEKNFVSTTVVGPRKREIGLVVPAKFSAYAADRRIADILSKEILKIKTKYSHFDLQYEEDKKLCKRLYLLEKEKS